MPLVSAPGRIAKLLGRDGWLLFAARSLRMFGYGSLAVVLVLYLNSAGLSANRVGLLLTCTLLGDTVISLWLTVHADRWGRRRTLLAGAVLMALAGVVFAGTSDFWLLLAAATIGVISPSGNEVGPFLSVEQAALAETLRDEDRTDVFAWYNLAGSIATAIGALAGGWLCQTIKIGGGTGARIYQPGIMLYALVGVVLAAMFCALSPATEPRAAPAGARPKLFLGLHQSRRVVLILAALFAVDAFGGGFVLQSLVADWFHVRYKINPAALGTIFFAANLCAAASALAAAALARRFGLLNTMVFTHLPSNVLLILVPLMPDLPLAIGLLLIRFSISQMDVPTRQSYTMAVVHPDERSAAAGVTAVARSIGASLSPYLAALLLSRAATLSWPFFLAGGIKIVYDVWLYWAFTRVPAEKTVSGAHRLNPKIGM
jgi:MFS family permease